MAIHNLLSRTTFDNCTSYAYFEVRAEKNGKLGSKKPGLNILQAFATLKYLLEKFAYHMLHRSTTLSTRWIVVTKTLHFFFQMTY
jgi:hypothetical protein